MREDQRDQRCLCVWSCVMLFLAGGRVPRARLRRHADTARPASASMLSASFACGAVALPLRDELPRAADDVCMDHPAERFCD